jgi:Zn-dependent protease with chaperone function
MLNTYLNFGFLITLTLIPFYFRQWAHERQTSEINDLNSMASKLCIADLVMMIVSSSLATHAKRDSLTTMVMGAAFISIMLIFSFRSQAAQKIRKIETTPKEKFIQSARSLGGFLSSIGLYYLIVYQLGKAIGTLPAVAVALVVVIGTAPLMVQILFSCQKMHPSTLKDEIRSVFEKAGVYLGEIYLMDTDRMKMSNALVCGSKYGFGPFKRSLFLTQNLFETLEEDELKAVICHEASHFQMHHIAKRGFSALFVIVMALLCVGLPIGLIAVTIQSKEWITTLTILNLIGNLIFQYTFIFRVIRKHEFEADLNAVNLGANPQALIRALEKISEFNGSSQVREDILTRMVMGNAHPTLEERKEALVAHHLPRSARILPETRFVVSYAMVVLIVGAWFVNANKESLWGPNREIASERAQTSQ